MTVEINGQRGGFVGEFQTEAGPDLPAGVEVRVTYDDAIEAHEVRYLLLDMLAQVNSWDSVTLIDTFTDPDDTLITAHDPDLSLAGGVWVLTTTDNTTPAANSVVITDNAMNINANARGAVIRSGFADVAVEVDVLHRAGSRYGIVLRHESNGSMLVFRIRGPEELAELLAITAGAIVVIGAAESITLEDNTIYRFRAVAKGQSVAVSRDGVEILSRTGVTDFETAEDQGIVAFGGTLANRYDNLLISAVL